MFFLRLFFCLESSFVYIGMEPALSKNGWILKKFEVTCPARNESHTPIGSMYMVYLLTFSININPGPDVGKYTFLVPWICNGLHFLQPRLLFISFFFIVTGDQPSSRWPRSSNEEIMTGQPTPPSIIGKMVVGPLNNQPHIIPIHLIKWVIHGYIPF